ncbi:DUF2399 domain-containing protein [Streptomyces rishiriensis]|nr:DUF2399 domain-containing protein [Streptomyces rishiriensis]
MNGQDRGRRLTEAPWDPELTRAMAAHGTAVVEEPVADIPSADLVEAIA